MTVLGMNVYGMNGYERHTNVPIEQAGPSVGDLTTASCHPLFALPTPSLAAYNGPINLRQQNDGKYCDASNPDSITHIYR